MLVISHTKESNTKLPWAIFIFIVVIFFFATPYDFYFSLQEKVTVEKFSEATELGSLGRRIGLIVLSLFSLFILFNRSNMINIPKGKMGFLIISFLMFSIASLLWTENFELTLRRVILLVMIWFSAFAVSIRFSYRDILYFAFIATAFCVIIGVLCEIALGTFTVIEAEYRFGGIVHPNIQALNCSVLLFSALSLSMASENKKWFFLMMSIVGLIFLVLTKSRTVFWTTIFALSIVFSMNTSKSILSLVILLAGFFICGYFILKENYIIDIDTVQTILMSPVGRQDSDISTLSSINGRIPVWKECMDYIAMRPLIGYGYGAFWTGERVLEISDSAGWVAPNAHNGYLDMALDIGVIGLVLFTLTLIYGLLRCISLFKHRKSVYYSFALSCIIFFSLSNILGSRFTAVHIPTFILSIIIIKLACDPTVEKVKAKK
jgi:O-antigen ligase